MIFFCKKQLFFNLFGKSDMNAHMAYRELAMYFILTHSSIATILCVQVFTGERE